MAAVTLRSMGVEWEDTKRILQPPDGPPTALDERLGNLFFAARAIGDCHRRGLLHVQIDEPNPHYEPSDDVQIRARIFDLGAALQPHVRQALKLFSTGQVRNQDMTTRRTLHNLQAAYADTEPNLLSILTKSMALDPPPEVSDTAIKHLSYWLSDAAEAGFAHSKPDGTIKTSELRETDYAVHRAERQELRQATLEALQEALRTWRETGELVVTWRGTTLNFPIPHHFSRMERVSTVLRAFGVAGDELRELKFNPYEVTASYQAVKQKLGIPANADPVLFLFANDYVKPSRPVPLDVQPYEPNLKLFIESLATPCAQLPHDHNVVKRAMYYLYHEIGVSRKQEALLVLAVNDLLPAEMKQSPPVPVPAKSSGGQRRYPTMHAAGHAPEKGDFAGYTLDEAQFEASFATFLEPSQDGLYNITWRGATFTFDIQKAVSKGVIKLALLHAFTAPQVDDVMSILGIGQRTYSTYMNQLKDHFQLTDIHHLQRGAIAALFHKGYIVNIDDSAYKAVRPVLSTDGLQMLPLLSRYPVSKISSTLGLPPHIVRRQGEELFRLFEVTCLPRLILSGILQKHIDLEPDADI